MHIVLKSIHKGDSVLQGAPFFFCSFVFRFGIDKIMGSVSRLFYFILKKREKIPLPAHFPFQNETAVKCRHICRVRTKKKKKRATSSKVCKMGKLGLLTFHRNRKNQKKTPNFLSPTTAVLHAPLPVREGHSLARGGCGRALSLT